MNLERIDKKLDDYYVANVHNDIVEYYNKQFGFKEDGKTFHWYFIIISNMNNSVFDQLISNFGFQMQEQINDYIKTK